MRRFLGVLLTSAVVAGAVLAAPAAAQTAHVRFDIDRITDSTITFAVGGARWISAGRTGLAVDPKQGDELIAEVRVIAVLAGEATAVVTGQTARIKPGHVVVFEVPGRPFYREPFFWIGAAAGGVIGFVIHTH